MLLKSFILLNLLLCYHCVPISNFWAPLFNPKILNYKVDVPFDPEAGKNDRAEFQRKYGFRGEKLIADLGNGKGPADYSNGMKKYGDVKFSYTYSGADKDVQYNY